MFGIGMPELLVILVVALVVLGPKRLPDVARTLGKAMAEFRRQTSDMMDEFQVQAMLDDEAPRRKAPAPATATASAAPGAASPAPSEPPAAAPAPEKPDSGRA
jgi:sec-independent protein translocase protein TatB